MKIYNFNRQPLFHTTNSLALLKSDVFNTNYVTYPKHIKAICFSRCNYYSHQVILDKESCFDTLIYGNKYENMPIGNLKCTQGVKMCFNTDLLIRDGYIPKPIDEAGLYAKHNGFLNKIQCKCNPDNTKIIPNYYFRKNGLLIEYEERIYKNIKNFHKYILFIEVYDKKHFNEATQILKDKELNIPILFNENISVIIDKHQKEKLKRFLAIKAKKNDFPVEKLKLYKTVKVSPIENINFDGTIFFKKGVIYTTNDYSNSNYFAIMSKKIDKKLFNILK